MDIKNSAKKFLPHIIALVIFIALSFTYLYPVLQGKVLFQMDGTHATGMAKEVVDFKEKTGETSMWTNSAFGGMPAYQIKGDASNNFFWYLNHIVRFGLPYSTVAIMFVYLLGFYILLATLGFKVWQSILGAFSFAFVSFNIIIIAAGHITQAYAIGLMAPVVAGFILTYKKKYIAGGILTLLSIGLQIATNHVQITYYLMLTLIVFGVFQLVDAIRNKEMQHFGKATLIVVVAALLAVGPNITQLWTTYEYGKETIRGKSDLTPPEGEKQSDGLDIDYAFAWSYGKVETLSLFIPDIVGGETGAIGADENALKNIPQDMQKTISQQNRYWGAQPFTSGPVYVGVIIFFLFVLGLFIVKDRTKWWLLAATILSILLAWGKNFLPFNEFLFHNLLLYNKFRTVSMALVIASITIPLLAMMTIKEIAENFNLLKEKKKEFYIATGLMGGLLLFIYIVPGIFDYIPAQEKQFIDQQQQQLMQNPEIADKQAVVQYFSAIKNSLVEARQSIMRADVMRSLIFMLLGAGTLFLYSIKIVKKELAFGLLGLFIVLDIWMVDTRYLNADKFQYEQAVANDFPKTTADDFILKDSSPSFRVLNLTRDPFSDAYTPYYHKSLGGYHGAKLRRYQEVIDHQLGREIQILQNAIQSEDKNQPSVYELVKSMNVINMLNTRHIIYNEKTIPMINVNALGNVWLVTDYQIVNNADEEIEALNSFDPEKTAIIDKRFTEGDNAIELPKTEFFDLDTGYVQLTSYAPNHLIYRSALHKPQVAVFSEIYYQPGWNAYIDGKPVKHFRANYILRAMVLPEGEHKIEFKFEPASFYAGQKISLATSIIVILLVIGSLGYYIKNIKFEPVQKKEVSQTTAKTEKKITQKRKKSNK